MPQRKTQKRFVDHGCGFPVVLRDVPMVKVRGVWTPDIDYNQLHQLVARTLAHKPARLTGAEVRFIRHYFELTLAAFGNYFDVTHPAVLKWEHAGNEAPAIKWSLERDIRLLILDRLGDDPRAVGVLYRQLRREAKPPSKKPLSISMAA